MKKQWYNIFFESRAKKFQLTEFLHHHKIYYEVSGFDNGYYVALKATEKERNMINAYLDASNRN